MTSELVASYLRPQGSLVCPPANLPAPKQFATLFSSLILAARVRAESEKMGGPVLDWPDRNANGRMQNFVLYLISKIPRFPWQRNSGLRSISEYQ